MKAQKETNRRWILASRPEGAPKTANFRLEKSKKPSPKEGEILLRTIYLSLDPYMRGRMSDAPSYAPPVELDDVMVGATISQVEESRHPDYQVGEWLLAGSGWQDYALSDGADLIRLGNNPVNPSYFLGVMGMPGLTAYVGLLEIGQPQKGETLVVAAATGPVGATVGQIGKLKGCRVVGIAGGEKKCTYAQEVLGFDECIDHYAPNFYEQLKESCPDGIDVYFESVGGKVFDSVLPRLNIGARVPVCGLVSMYNATKLPDGPDRLSLLMANILVKSIKVQGFIIFNYYQSHYSDFIKDMSEWLKTDQVKYREQMVDQLENSPDAFIGLLKGDHLRKQPICQNYHLLKGR